jgi:AraC-like DNA-binding protein
MQQLHTNTKSFTTVTKQYLRGTPAQIIQNIKNTRSKTQASKNNSIQTVAFDLGFDQPTYFTKYFKRQDLPKQFQAIIP